MKKHATIALLIVLLTACAPTADIPVDAQNIAMSIVQTDIARTQTALPTVTPSPTATPLPSPYPTQPPLPILTPDAVQVERWREYEAALAKVILPMFEYMVLCEWDILGRSELEVYVWATCRIPGANDSRPAVIRLGLDGAIQEVEVPRRGHSSNVDELFPKQVQEKFDAYTGNSIFDGRIRELYDHLVYRETHPETPPLVVLSSYTPLPTATPTP